MMAGFRIKYHQQGVYPFFRVSVSPCAGKKIDAIQMRGEPETISTPGYHQPFRKEAPAP
jgi:hypothetical protein